MLSRITIRNRVIGAFSLTLCATLALGLFSVHRLIQVNDTSETIATDWLPSALVIGDVSRDFEVYRTHQAQILMHSGEDRSQLVADIAKARHEVEADLNAYAPYITPGKEAVLAKQVQDDVATYMTESDNYIAKITSQDDDGATQHYLDTLQPLAQKVHASIRADRNYQMTEGQAAAKVSVALGQSAETLIYIALGVTAFICLLIGVAMIRTICRPINRMSDAMRTLAKGQLDIAIPSAGERNEIGDMASAVEIFKDGLIRNKALEAEAERSREAAEAQRKQIMLDLADSFEAAVGDVVEMVSSAATEMQATASQLTSSAQEAASQAVSVSAAAEQAGANVTSVASSAEELGASVNEIGRQVGHSREKAQEAVTEANATAGIVNELSEAAGRITGIVELISTIASQTNLLALNATIESARAGEAGKGFAVVANEVKTLAGQTSKATAEISQQIGNIQTTTKRAVEAIAMITGTIHDINDSSATIAMAVDQQGAATTEIVQAVSQASIGTTEVTHNITGVARVAEETGIGAHQVLTASSELARQAAYLRTQVNGFLAQVRAA